MAQLMIVALAILILLVVMVLRLFIECSVFGAQQLSGRIRPHRRGNQVTMNRGWFRCQFCQAPVCRPWDRGDLVRRLSTFKSMTWFAEFHHLYYLSRLNAAAILWMLDCDIMINVSLIMPMSRNPIDFGRFDVNHYNILYNDNDLFYVKTLEDFPLSF